MLEAEEVIDEEAFGKLCALVAGEGPEGIRGFVDDFLESARGLLARMDEASAAGDAVSLERAAHSLKSTSAMYGALKLSGLCEAVELAARKGVSDETAEGLAALTAHHAPMQRAFEERLEQEDPKTRRKDE